MTLRDLLDQADAGPWWFDGRDIFHRRPGTNLDQLILPIPSAEETFHPTQAVNPATAKLASLAPELAVLVADAEIWIVCEYEDMQEGLRCLEANPDELCGGCEWIARLRALERKIAND